MKTFEELEELRARGPIGPKGRGIVRRICLRLGAGRHQSAERAELTLEDGVVGDRWRVADDPERSCQVTFMNARVADWIAHGDTLSSEAGDNFHVDLDLSELALPIGIQVRLGTALLEVTAEPHLGCKKFRERFGAGALRWVNHADLRLQRLRGANLRVLEAGEVRVGDDVVVLQTP
jgi:MOSC domain-containing protein YiiM